MWTHCPSASWPCQNPTHFQSSFTRQESTLSKFSKVSNALKFASWSLFAGSKSKPSNCSLWAFASISCFWTSASWCFWKFGSFRPPFLKVGWLSPEIHQNWERCWPWENSPRFEDGLGALGFIRQIRSGRACGKILRWGGNFRRKILLECFESRLKCFYNFQIQKMSLNFAGTFYVFGFDFSRISYRLILFSVCRVESRSGWVLEELIITKDFQNRLNTHCLYNS